MYVSLPFSGVAALDAKEVKLQGFMMPLEMGDKQSHFVMEQYIPGDIYHVDCLVSEGKVVFAEVSRTGLRELGITALFDNNAGVAAQMAGFTPGTDVVQLLGTFAGLYASEVERRFGVLFVMLTPLGLIALGNVVFLALGVALVPHSPTFWWLVA
mgnify:CR=1 FL=1